MKKMIFLALTLFMLPLFLISQEIPAGTKVKVLDIHIEDSYYGTKTRFVGKSGVTAEPLSESAEGTGWYAGPIKIDGETSSNYFYAVSLEFIEMTSESPATSKRETRPTIIVGGTKVMILDISPEDAYYDDRLRIIGQKGDVKEFLEVSNEGKGWYAGEVILEGSDNPHYFYAVSIKIVSGEDEGYMSVEKGDYSTEPTVPIGSKIVVKDIHPEDAYHSNKTMYIGEQGVLKNGPLKESSIGPGWYGGEVIMDNPMLGSLYFYAVSVKVVSDK